MSGRRPRTLEDGAGRPVGRRRFLQLGGFALAGAFTRALWLPPVARAMRGESSERGPILVLLVLQGGNDGLNTVVPYRDPLYRLRRPRLAIPREAILPLAEDLALHPSLRALAPLWEAGDLAVLRGVGYPDMNLSHFRGSDIVWSASGAETTLSSGWLARWLEGRHPEFPMVTPEQPLALQQGFAAGLPLQGERGQTGIVVDNPASFQELVGRTFSGEWDDTLGGDPGDLLLRAVRAIDAASFAYAEAVQGAALRGRNRLTYPRGHLADQLATVARLIDGELGTPVFLVSQDGFDTHANQLDFHAGLLRTLAEAVAAFFADLAAMERADDVVLLTVSEFGRRVGENASRGTDHGTAAPWFAVGPSVLGGVYGAPPDLQNLDPAGNLAVSLDYRSIYAAVLGTWFGTQSTEVARVLPGGHLPLPFVTAHPANPPEDPGEPETPGDPGAPDEPGAPAVTRTEIRAVLPNPGAEGRTVVFDLVRPGAVRVSVHGADGRLLHTLAETVLPAGRHRLDLRLGDLAAGVYVLRIATEGAADTKKLVVR